MTRPWFNRDDFWRGVRSVLPVVPSYIPFGLVCGVAAVQAGLEKWGAVVLSGAAFGGSSQAVLTQFLLSGAPIWVAILSGIVMNLRMAVYSAAIAGMIPPETSIKHRLMWAVFLVDQAMVLLQRERAEKPNAPPSLSYYLGVSAVLWPWWVVWNAIGAWGGAALPASWHLEFVIPLSFIAMILPALKSRGALLSAVMGGVGGVLLFALPLKLGLIVACALAVWLAFSIETWARWKY